MPELIPISLYLRYSSHAQRDTSIEQQRIICTQYAESHGMKIVAVYEDRALTGTSDNRPGFQSMMSDSESATWEAVLVYALDRFARNRYDSAVYKRQLKSRGIRVLSATESISDDPSGIIMESLMEGLAEYYSAELSSKIRRGMDDNARKFMTIGAVPLGYCRGEDGRYKIVEHEAAVVREIFTRVLREPIADIIRDLNARNIPTKSGNPWNKSSLNKMLSNDRYIGVYTYKGNKTPDAIPPIIEKSLYAQVQEHLSIKPQARRIPGTVQRRRMESGTYLLTGKAFCGECGEPMTGKSGHGKLGTLHHYYQCRAHTAHTCPNRAVRRDDLELSVASLLNNLIMDDSVVEAIADSTVSYQQAQAGASDLDNLKARKKETDTALKNLLRAIEMGIFNATTKNRMEELEQQSASITYQIDAITARMGKLMTRDEIIAAIEIFREGDISDKHYQESLFDAFLVSVHVFSDGRFKLVATVGGSPRTLESPSNSTLSPASSASPASPHSPSGVRIKGTTLHHLNLGEHQLIISNGFLMITAKIHR